MYIVIFDAMEGRVNVHNRAKYPARVRPPTGAKISTDHSDAELDLYLRHP